MDRTAANDASESLGLELRPGASHYRAYVGPPVDYDLVAAMSLRPVDDAGFAPATPGPGHRLRVAASGAAAHSLPQSRRLHRPGAERVAGARRHRQRDWRGPGPDQATHLRLRRNGGRIDRGRASLRLHAGPIDLQPHRARPSGPVAGRNQPTATPTGALVATFIPGDVDTDRRGWIYPDCVAFNPTTMA